MILFDIVFALANQRTRAMNGEIGADTNQNYQIWNHQIFVI